MAGLLSYFQCNDLMEEPKVPPKALSMLEDGTMAELQGQGCYSCVFFSQNEIRFKTVKLRLHESFRPESLQPEYITICIIFFLQKSSYDNRMIKLLEIHGT